MTEECYICGNGTWANRPGRLRDDPSIGVLECRECGVVVPEEQTHVAVDYSSGSMHGNVRPDVDAWRDACQPDDSRRFGAICEILRPGEGVLDFGCGSGGFVEMLRVSGVQSYGVELDESAVSHLRSSGLEVVTQLQDLTRGMRAKVQVVTLFHVLEHLRDPLGLINALIDDLPNAHTFIVEVPSSEDPLLQVLSCPSFEAFTYWLSAYDLTCRCAYDLMCRSVSGVS